MPHTPRRTPKMPVIFLPHGGGPWPFVDVFGGPAAWAGLRAYLEALPAALPAAPRAVVIISAHWEEARPTVMAGANPPMHYDYYGFPPASYTLTWPAPGDPVLAARVRALIEAEGLPAGEDAERGFDHGTFVPMKVAWPDADIPTVQLSLIRGLDPATHLRLGRALAPLRDEGVLILASGMSYHNMRGFGTAQGAADAERFDAWLQQVVTQPRAARDAALTSWAQAPGGRASHPREEHLLPLMIAAGAAGDDLGRVPYSEPLIGTRVSAVHFG